MWLVGDAYLSTLQFMKLMRLENILKNKPILIHMQNEFNPMKKMKLYNCIY